jgi:hypothetical protein
MQQMQQDDNNRRYQKQARKTANQLLREYWDYWVAKLQGDSETFFDRVVQRFDATRQSPAE